MSTTIDVEILKGKGDFLLWCKKMKAILIQVKVAKGIETLFSVITSDGKKIETYEIVLSTPLYFISNNVLRRASKVKTAIDK